MKTIFPCVLLFLSAAACGPLVAQSSGDTDAQRQLREDRERFSREVERQAAEARAREAEARTAASEQRTAEELERQRAQQSRQAQTIESLRQSDRLRQSTPLPPPTSVRTSTVPAPQPALPVGTIAPDFSVTFLADGNCVIYVKDRPPEVRSPADAEKILGELLRAKTGASASPKK